MSLDAFRGEALEDLVEDLGDLRHDLGKYVSFEARFVGAEGPEGELRAALEKDLHRTREARGRVESAWELWARLKPEGLDQEPEVQRIQAALDALALLDLDGGRAVLEAALAHATEIGEACRALHRRAADLLDA